MTDPTQRVYDALLIVRYQAGDNEALEELIRRHESSVRAGIVRRLGGNSSAVDDIGQQVWLEVLKGLARLDEPMAWSAWLGRIVRCQVALFLRRKERALVPLDAVLDRPAQESDPPLDWRRLMSAVEALGEPYLQMLRMRFWESCSYQEIADALQIPVGTVRSRLHWARAQVAKQLRDEGPDK